MNTKLTIVATVATLLFSQLATAQISKETFKCQNFIKKGAGKFADKVADNIEKCLMAVQKCNLKPTPAATDVCIGKLLVVDKGRCAVGKLAGDEVYYGNDSAANNDSTQGVINKELGKFISTVAKCDFANVQFGNLGLADPGDALALVDQLNDFPNGAACTAHKRIKVTMPNRDDLFQQIVDHENFSNFPLSIVVAFTSSDNCR